MASLSKAARARAKRKGNKAKRKAFFQGESTLGMLSAGKKARVASERKSAVKEAITTSVKKSFKSGRATGAAVTARAGENSTTFISKKSPVLKAAAAAGRGAKRVRKLTEEHKRKIARALRGRRR